jgi:hypothetical protein
MKEHNRTPSGAGPVQINGLTMLVWQRHVRELLPDCRSDVRKINGGRHKHSSFRH